MKRIILSVMVLALAVAVQAGDDKSCQDKDKAGCCASKVQTSLQATTSQDNDKAGCCASKVKTSNEAQGSCSLAKGEGCKQAPVKQSTVKQTALLSPKAAADASK